MFRNKQCRKKNIKIKQEENSMTSMATLKAVLSFIGLTIMYFGVWFVYCTVTCQAFTVLAFQPFILLGFLLAAFFYAARVYMISDIKSMGRTR